MCGKPSRLTVPLRFLSGACHSLASAWNISSMEADALTVWLAATFGDPTAPGKEYLLGAEEAGC